MSAIELTFTPARQAELIALFTPSRDVLTSRVAEVGRLSAENGDLSSAKIHAALVRGLDVAPVGLSAASVGNALAAYRLAHANLSAKAAPRHYAEVLEAVHAVRVKPLREAWEAAIKAAKLPASADAKRAALIAEAIKAATNAADAAKAAAKAEREAAKAGQSAPAEPAEPAEPVTLTPATPADAAEAALTLIANVRAMLANIADADALTLIAAEAAGLSADAAERAASLAPVAEAAAA